MQEKAVSHAPVDQHRDGAGFAPLLAALPQPAAVVSAAGGVLGANPAWKQLSGERGSATIHDYLDSCITDSVGRSKFRRQVRTVLEQQLATTRIDHCRELQGADVLLRLTLTALPGQAAALAVVEDRTLHCRLADGMRQRSRMLSMVAEGVLVLDEELRVLEVNQAFCSLLDLPAGEITGKSLSRLIAGSHVDLHVANQLAALGDNSRWSGDVALARATGGERLVRLGVACLRVAATAMRSYVAVATDLSHDIERHRALNASAGRDALTGLPNRASLAFDVDVAIAHTQAGDSHALVLIGIDRFSLINDSLGYAAGDQLLNQVAGALRASLSGGELVARLASDEFAVYTPLDPASAQAEACVEQLRETLRRPFAVAGQQIFLTVSVGVSSFPQDGCSFDDLLRSAGAALHAAKRAGANRVVHYLQQIGDANIERLSLRAAMDSAIARREFVVHYQPTVDLRTGRVASVEALVRWQHPVLGLIMPERFISLAEDYQLIGVIGEHVLMTAAAAACRWRSAGNPALRMAVNLSARQLSDTSLPERICRVLDATGLPPAGLRLEVTESVVMNDPAAAGEILAGLAEAGVEIAIDDFGTGYSSLACLQRLPLDCLKVDRSFVRDVPGLQSSEAIVRAIIALGKSLGLRLVAEGVETVEQAQFLRAAGCDEAQGYLYCRPVSEDECGSWLAAEHSASAPLPGRTP